MWGKAVGELAFLSSALPEAQHWSPPAAPHAAFAAPGPAVHLHQSRGAGPSGWELAGSHIPKITPSITPIQGIPASSTSLHCHEMCPASCTQQAWGQHTDPGRCLPTHGLTLRLASWEKWKLLVNTFSQLAASPKTPHTHNPISQGAAQSWRQKSSLGQPYSGPGAPGCYRISLPPHPPPCFVNVLFLDSLLLFMATEEGAMLVMCSPHSRLYPWPISVHDLQARH